MKIYSKLLHVSQIISVNWLLVIPCKCCKNGQNRVDRFNTDAGPEIFVGGGGGKLSDKLGPCRQAKRGRGRGI